MIYTIPIEKRVEDFGPDGLLTPPVGTALFVASNVTKVPLTRLSIRVLPFIGVMMLVTLVIAFIPETVTWVIR